MKAPGSKYLPLRAAFAPTGALGFGVLDFSRGRGDYIVATPVATLPAGASSVRLAFRLLRPDGFVETAWQMLVVERSESAFELSGLVVFEDAESPLT